MSGLLALYGELDMEMKYNFADYSDKMMKDVSVTYEGSGLSSRRQKKPFTDQIYQIYWCLGIKKLKVVILFKEKYVRSQIIE